MRTVEEQRKVFEEVWDRGRYRLGSEGLRLVPTVMGLIPRQEINDYGSGTGRCAAELVRHGYKVNCIDIAANALEDDARAMIGKGITLHIGSLSELPPEIPAMEWGICLDVLMTIPMQMMDQVLKEIRRTARNLIVEVYGWQDTRLGYDLTATMLTRKEWVQILEGHWANVQILTHPHTDVRYLYICRSL